MSTYPPGPPATQFPGGNPFADSPNPYATPQIPAGYQPPQAPPGPYAGLWRQGNLLVMHKMAPLPEICVKSNQPATRKVLRNLQWHHPALALTIFAGLLVYIILVAILLKRASIYVPLTEEWYQRRRKRLWIGWLGGLTFVGLMILGMFLSLDSRESLPIWLIVLGLVGAIGMLIWGQYATSMVRPKRITDEFIWLKGVHPDFLNRLQVWPYNI